jgi:phosphoglycolate phosphatase-like HAD superfamily hydrolase
VPAVQEAFAQFGLTPASEDEIVRSIGTSMYDYEAWLKAQCVEVDADAVLETTNRLELEHVKMSASLYAGALPILETFKAAGHFIATATNAPKDYFDAVLDEHGLRPLIDLPLCKGDGFASKTVMVMRAMSTCPDRPAVVIGDRRDDVDAAHANGAMAIGAEYGYGADGELEEADARILSLARLPLVLP